MLVSQSANGQPEERVLTWSSRTFEGPINEVELDTWIQCPAERDHLSAENVAGTPNTMKTEDTHGSEFVDRFMTA